MHTFDDDTFKEFGKSFVERYLQNGFSSMPKREMDILVFHLLRCRPELKDKSIYELSNIFRISEAKVKALILEGSLRHDVINHKAIIGGIVHRYISKLEHIDMSDGFFEIALDNPIEKREFERAVKMTGHHAEYGINRDILKIRPIRFLEIILQNAENGEKEFVTLVKKAVADVGSQKAVLDKSLSFREKINRLGEEINDKAGLIGLLGSAVALL
jgi:hypothetical protein